MDLFGLKLSDAEVKLLTVLASLAVIIVTWLTRGGRKADQETKAKTTTEREDTKDMSMRDLVVETFRSALSAEASAVEAKKAGVSLAAKIDENHGEVKNEIIRLDGRIDGVLKIATEAGQMARAAAGTRSADETLRHAAAAATPPGGTPAPATGTEG